MRSMGHPRVLGHLSSNTMVLKWMDAFVPRDHLEHLERVSVVVTGEWGLLDVFSGSGQRCCYAAF